MIPTMEMKLRKDADIARLLKAISSCTGEVYFLLGESGYLNLTSLFSRYVFSVACAEPEFVEAGVISCKNQSDYARLAEYLRNTDEQEREEI